MERWRPIPGYYAYEASTAGNIRRVKTGLILKTRPDKDGYRRLNLCQFAGVVVTVRVLVLVLTAFRGERPVSSDGTRFEGDHIDRVRNNDRLSNLRWVTHLDNMRNSRRWERVAA